ATLTRGRSACACYHEWFPPAESPSSRGLGRGPFKAKTRVRIPMGTPNSDSRNLTVPIGLPVCGTLLRSAPAAPNPDGDATHATLTTSKRYRNWIRSEPHEWFSRLWALLWPHRYACA